MSDRVLIIANALISNAERTLPPSVGPRPEAELMVVAPTLTTRLQSFATDIDAARKAAAVRLHQISVDMSRFRSAPEMAVGDENQVVAAADALARFDADKCIVVSHIPQRANYHERGVAERIRGNLGLPTTLITVDDAGLIVDHRSY